MCGADSECGERCLRGGVQPTDREGEPDAQSGDEAFRNPCYLHIKNEVAVSSTLQLEHFFFCRRFDNENISLE